MRSQLSEGLDETINHFKLNAQELAEKAGVRPATLSEYRHGKREIHTSNLEKIIQALPQEARLYFFTSWMIGEVDDDSLALILNAVAQRLRGKKSLSAEQRLDAALSLSR